MREQNSFFCAGWMMDREEAKDEFDLVGASRSVVFRPMNLLALLFIAAWSLGHGSNWAQTSGEVAQNIVIPYKPAPVTPHWSARYGMTAVISPATNLSSFDYVYILGGDSYDGDDTRRNFKPGLLDTNWENGYKNDVWRTTGVQWYVKGDVRLQTQYDQKIPRVYSKLEWEKVTDGIRPPLGMTHDDWISCEDYFRNRDKPGVDCTDRRDVQWSPRRNHASVFFKGYIWVLGGRAREFVNLPEEQSVGGITSPHVQDIPRTANNELQQFSTQREVSVYKSDVWKSVDGVSWTLVTPGCRAPQESGIALGNEHEGLYGVEAFACGPDRNTCYGAESCNTEKMHTCVCDMWSPREQHAVAVYGANMYLSGGYTSRLYSQFSNCKGYACGNTNAGDYRFYLSDVWKSSDGEIWEQITPNAFPEPLTPNNLPLGRGGHVMLTLQNNAGEAFLYVIGGRGGDNSFRGGPEVYFNDIWAAPVSAGSPTTWTKVEYQGHTKMPWSPRTGHSVVIDPPTPENGNVRTMYLYGGYDEEGNVLDDLWAWRLDGEDIWRKDFTTDSLYSTGTGDDLQFLTHSPSLFYVSPDSPLEFLRRLWTPTKPDSTTGARYELREYIPEEDLETMRSVGLTTIRDLANADLYTILKLRGFDIPQVPAEDRLHVDGICDYRAFALAMVDRCELNVPSLYDGERQMPWNVVPEFGGPAPSEVTIKWHGRTNYDMLEPPVDDVDVRTAAWDGCTYEPFIQGLHGPNVNGLGYVTQVTSIRNPLPEVQNLFCKQTPGPRVFASMTAFKGLVYLFGGKESNDKFHADAWYRDARLPSTTIIRAPKHRSSDEWFIFSANKAGCYFEYRIWDPHNYKEIRPWSPVTFKTSIYWLNWREGGPGNGEYTLYVRAVDPAGNRDDRFIDGVNVYRWYYVSPTPWDIIGGLIGAFIGLCIIAYFEYRRRVKKAAMERYAMKRMRRKFKAMQRDVDGKAVDWRTLYMESKQAEEMGKRERKKLKKTRDKNAEKREKEKKKREKEKELIKRKLKANKEFRAKSKAETTSKSSQVAPTPTPQALEAVPEEDEEDVEAQNVKKTRTKIGNGNGAGRSGTKVLPSSEESFDAIETGESGTVSLKETESGFKARKVNKRYKAYEQSVVPEAVEEKDEDDHHNKDK